MELTEEQLDRALKLGLMLAWVHSDDGDCLGAAASELIKLLDDKLNLDALYEEFDC